MMSNRRRKKFRERPDQFLGEARQTGYTLIEVLVYLLVLAVAVGAIISLLAGLLNWHAGILTHRELNSGLNNSFERLTREIKNALEVNWQESDLGVSPGRLVLESRLVEEQVTFTVSENGHLVFIKDDGVHRLTPENILVEELVFRQLTSGRSQGVRVEASFASRRDPSRVKEATVSAMIRGSY